MNLFTRYESNDMKNWRTRVNMSLLFSQINSSSSQLSVCRQCVNTLSIDLSVTESAVNQNASINKNSKSSNSRSLRQHTSAKSISFCCLCFCLFWEIDRFIILICRYLSHQFDKILNKILILVIAYIYDLSSFFSHIFCFRIYLFTSIASALNLSISIMICHAVYESVNEFLRNVDRSEERNSRFETKLEEDEEIVLRACLRISIQILSYQRKFIWRLMWLDAHFYFRHSVFM